MTWKATQIVPNAITVNTQAMTCTSVTRCSRIVGSSATTVSHVSWMSFAMWSLALPMWILVETSDCGRRVKDIHAAPAGGVGCTRGTKGLKPQTRQGLTRHRGGCANHCALFGRNRRQSTHRQNTSQEVDRARTTEIRDDIVALGARRVELETLIAEDLGHRFFSGTEKITEIVTNKVEADGAFAESRTAKARYRSHFIMA